MLLYREPLTKCEETWEWPGYRKKRTLGMALQRSGNALSIASATDAELVEMPARLADNLRFAISRVDLNRLC
jgi:hypothetical protein